MNEKTFIGFHTRFANHDSVKPLLKLLKEGLVPVGINTLILEFNPGYTYKCFPEYSNGTVTYEDLQEIKTACKNLDVEVIPLFQCLSHQSANFGGGKAWPLLLDHPEFCERKKYINGGEWPDLYCHSWCASNDDIYNYIFPMMDEIIEGLGATACHIGIDEVFEIGEEECPLCHGKNKAELLAHTIKIIHDHLAKNDIKTLMWGDRLLDADKLGYQMWEADRFGMHPAFDMENEVTRDIVITDWHYDMHSAGYPSVGKFMEAGFDTIACVGANEVHSAHFWKHCLEFKYLGDKLHWKGKLKGILFTQWDVLTKENVQELFDGLALKVPYKEDSWTADQVGRTVKTVMTKGLKI